MATNPNDSIHNSEQAPQDGLTKREYFAVMRQVKDDELDLEIAKLIMTEEFPDNVIDRIKWFTEAKEKYCVMRADALIKALNKK